jgi:hypothetical protein
MAISGFLLRGGVALLDIIVFLVYFRNGMPS